MPSAMELLPKYLQTDRLTLELLNQEDPKHMACMLGALNNPTAHQRMGDFGIRTPAELIALHLKTRLKTPLQLNRELIYVIHVGDENGPLAGTVTMGQRKAAIPGDIGWALLEEHIGKGYATEAAREFLRFLREDFGLKDIITWPDETNRQSNRVAEKLGFIDGGKIKNADEPGKMVAIWILPGMSRLDENLSISFWPES
jgi:RimJ/RimL family protein N-acetyltransferase